MNAPVKPEHLARPAHTATLYQLADEYMEGLAILADADVPPEVVFDTLEGMQGELVDKVDAVMAYAANLQALATVRKAEAERLAKSAKSLESKVEGLHTYVQIILARTGIKLPLVTGRFTLNLAKNPPSTDVVDEGKLPSLYKTETVTLSGSPGLCEQVRMAIEQSSDTFGILARAAIDSKVTVDKKALLTDLKTVAAANEAKQPGDARDAIPGARLQPTSYRLTVK